MREPAPDDLIAARFRVTGLLGNGATASVYAATDTDDGRAVALKVLGRDLAASPDARRAFLDEAARMSSVRHRALAGLVASGESAEVAWSAWELAPGRSLAEEIRIGGPLNADAAIALSHEILGGLDALHEAGLCHRDISPSNIVVDLHPDRSLRAAALVDFGLVGPIGQTTRGSDLLRSSSLPGSDLVVGNVHFAPPELLRGDGVGIAGDLYELGGCLFFALAGTTPFPRATSEEVARAHRSALPPTLSSLGIPVAVHIDRAIVRSMLKDVDARFASAGDMQKALGQPPRGRIPAPVTVTVPRTVAYPGGEERTLPDRTRVLRAEDEAPPVVAQASGGRGSGGAIVGWIAAFAAAAALVAGWSVLGTAGDPPVAAESPDPSPSQSIGPAPVAPPPQRDPEPDVTDPVTATPPITVPAVVGMSLTAARDGIDTADLRVGSVIEEHSPHVAGTVLRAEPDIGTEVVRGASVTLIVASGSNGVPAIEGTTLARARDAVVAAGFTPLTVSVESSAPAGTILGSRPAGGVVVLIGTSIVIEVAEQAPAPAPLPTPTETPAATPPPDGEGDS